MDSNYKLESQFSTLSLGSLWFALQMYGSEASQRFGQNLYTELETWGYTNLVLSGIRFSFSSSNACPKLCRLVLLARKTVGFLSEF